NASIDNGSFDEDGDPVTLSQSPAGPYPLGTTPVTLTVTEPEGLSNSCTASVTVVDTTPPVISSVSAFPNVLWPPNHKMVPVTVAVSASDVCSPIVTCKITSVTSNESVNGPGSGHTAPDWQITGDLSVDLRAERSATGNGRVYTLVVQCTDASNNSSSASTTVSVPHDQ